MLPFAINFRTGKAVHEQVLLAVRRAVTSGQLKPGDRFPSVRVLSQELHINPNTAQRVVRTLVEEGLLKSQPGIGMVVAQIEPPTAHQKEAIVEQQIERLVMDARIVSLDLEDLLGAVQKAWHRLVRTS